MVTCLSNTDKKKFAAAIRRGYFEDFDANPQAWKHTFAGAYLWKNPTRVKTLDIFRETIGHIPVWEDLTDINLEDFAEAMSKHYAANTAKNRFAEVKAVVNRHRNEIEIPSRRFDKILYQRQEPSQAVYLNEEEIERIHRYVPHSKTEAYVKKVFLIEAYTGARNCDSVRLTPDNCNIETNRLIYTSLKTRTLITLPVHKNLMQYLRDNANESVSLSTFNDTLRRICQEVRICERTTIYRRGGETTDEKWNFVSSHTGRRSFATNLFIRHADPSTIARFMGHSSPEITIKRYIIGYIKESPEVLAFFG